jgi:hypothetical protein
LVSDVHARRLRNFPEGHLGRKNMCISSLSEYWDSTTQVTVGLDGCTNIKLLPRPEGCVKADFSTEPVKLTLSAEDLRYLDDINIPWLQGACSFSGGVNEAERTAKIRAMIRGMFGPTPPAWLKVGTPAASPAPPTQARVFGSLTNTYMTGQPLQCSEILSESPEVRLQELEAKLRMQQKKLIANQKVL